MPTPGERNALLFFAGIIVLGSGTRVIGAFGGAAPATAEAVNALDRQIATVDSVRKRGKPKGKGKRAKRPEPVAPSIVDLDVATAAEIETLRGVGPALAKRIVADRDSLGPFGSLEQLERVRGIGPALARKLDSTVTFSLLPRPSTTEATGSSAPKRRRKARRGDNDS
ncbi:MAG TPA: helix-hairpin-helix domain-containing protein [Gemmatimonadaceae bacterium]|nr:helix-hairpin-helix domain-containing protein [Gemmatimonadaceae bacterium]